MPTLYIDDEPLSEDDQKLLVMALLIYQERVHRDRKERNPNGTADSWIVAEREYHRAQQLAELLGGTKRLRPKSLRYADRLRNRLPTQS